MFHINNVEKWSCWAKLCLLHPHPRCRQTLPHRTLTPPNQTHAQASQPAFLGNNDGALSPTYVSWCVSHDWLVLCVLSLSIVSVHSVTVIFQSKVNIPIIGLRGAGLRMTYIIKEHVYHTLSAGLLICREQSACSCEVNVFSVNQVLRGWHYWNSCRVSLFPVSSHSRQDFVFFLITNLRAEIGSFFQGEHHDLEKGVYFWSNKSIPLENTRIEKRVNQIK